MREVVGVIGLGSLGTLVMSALVDEGYEVFVYDIDEERTQAATSSDGAHLAPSPAVVAGQSDVVVVTVGSGDQVEDVLFGTDGVASGMGEDTVVAVSSTVHPDQCVEWADRIGASGGLVDAPIARGPLIPDRDALVLLGGPDAELNRVEPIFSAIAGSVVHLGEVGAGQCGKLANNQIFWTCHIANYEAVRLSRQFNVDETELLDALKKGSGENYALHRWGKVSGEWATEDLDVVLEMAGGVSIDLPLVRQVRDVYEDLDLADVWDLEAGDVEES